ncbi:hypothetical protein [Nonomuraea wenchangensis]|uniref:Uncharacterized protein n=1 Tax=Nonomuraea wenchangensis TaxID=568860 RepID=A0A1I0IPH3_9ACTN|nr:hypothetical protein [Nonomuraea wenchangensis]SET98266.1 hypothetical protein SAMN05421811_10566 [Nonomuraea wenchangensis]
MCDITITCGTCTTPDPEPEPPTPYRPLRHPDLNGWATASAPPEAATSTLTVPAQTATMYTAKAILPAGRTLSSLYVAVHSPATGRLSGEARLAVYESEFGPFHRTPDLPALFGQVGFRRAELETRVEASDEDRIIYLAALIPAYTVPPTLLTTAPVPPTAVPDDAYQLWAPISGRRCETASRSALPATVGGDSGFTPVDRIVLLTADGPWAA